MKRLMVFAVGMTLVVGCHGADVDVQSGTPLSEDGEVSLVSVSGGAAEQVANYPQERAPSQRSGTCAASGSEETRSLSPVLFNTVEDTFGVGMTMVRPEEEHIQIADLPHGVKLSHLVAYHDRFDSGSMPEQRALASLVKRDLKTGEVSLVGAVASDQSGQSTYEGHHGFTVTLDDVVDRTINDYYVRFNGEAGYNATSTVWYGCTVTFTYP